MRSPPPPPSAAPSTICTAGGSVACLVLVLFPVKLCPPVQHKNEVPHTPHLQQCPPSLVPPSAGTASPPRTPLPPLPGIQTRFFKAVAGCTAAAARCRKPTWATGPIHGTSGSTAVAYTKHTKAGPSAPFHHTREPICLSLPSPPPRAPVAPRKDRSLVPCTGSAPQMVSRNKAGSHGSATVEPQTLYFSPVYYSMQRVVNTCDKTATMPRNSELVETMIPALRGCGESWKTS